MIIQITPEMFEKARTLAHKVYDKEKSLGIKDKFVNKAARYNDEIGGDFYGFLGEFCFAKCYNLPEPVFTSQYKDTADFIICGKKCDLKTRRDDKLVLINLTQYNKKKGLIDVFIFAEVYDKYFRSIGWIEYDKIPEISNLLKFPNTSQAFRIKLKFLNKMEELIPKGVL